MKFTLEFWKEDLGGKKSKRVLLAEWTWDTNEDSTADITVQVAGIIAESLRCNADDEVTQ